MHVTLPVFRRVAIITGSDLRPVLGPMLDTMLDPEFAFATLTIDPIAQRAGYLTAALAVSCITASTTS